MGKVTVFLSSCLTKKINRLSIFLSFILIHKHTHVSNTDAGSNRLSLAQNLSNHPRHRSSIIPQLVSLPRSIHPHPYHVTPHQVFVTTPEAASMVLVSRLTCSESHKHFVEILHVNDTQCVAERNETFYHFLTSSSPKTPNFLLQFSFDSTQNK